MSNRRALGAEAARAGRRALADLSEDLREARFRAGLTQQRLAARVGISQSQVSRIEQGDYLPARVDDLTRLAGALGLRLSLRAWPSGQPLRDQAQLDLLRRLRGRCSPTWQMQFEFAVPGTGELRAWDLVLRGDGVRIGVEAVTRLRDVQALLRSTRIKQRDSGLDRTLVVVAATHANRRAMASAGQALPDLAAQTRVVLRALRAGRDPGTDAWILL